MLALSIHPAACRHALGPNSSAALPPSLGRPGSRRPSLRRITQVAGLGITGKLFWPLASAAACSSTPGRR